jgi:ribosomal protein S27AE
MTGAEQWLSVPPVCQPGGGIVQQSKQCPKCAGLMTEGFVLDKAHGSVGVSRWVEGTAQASVWTGVKLTGRPQMAISTWRCGRCGFLESYASGEPDPSDAAQKQTLAAILAVACAVAALLAVIATYLSHRVH